MGLHGIIISGGSGTRLWPISRINTPKQFIPLIENNNTSLFEQTLERISHTTTLINNSNSNNNNIIVVSSYSHENYINDVINSNSNNINIELILEPLSRDTAMAIAVSMFHVFKNMTDKCEEEYALICPSDHYIPNIQQFNKMIQHGYDVAKNNYLVTFGITPTHPETGYGYILKSDTKIDKYGYIVSKFTEKPDLETAKKFMSDGNYTWNSGIFIFPVRLFLSELKYHCPDIYHSAKSMLYKNETGKLSKTIYQNVPKISIDYAVLEHSHKIAVVPTNLNWSDVGSWKSLWNINLYSDKNEYNNNNIIVGDVISESNSNCYIKNKSDKKLIAVGLDDISIIVQDDAILILNMDQSQQIKKVVDLLPKTLK